MCPLPSEVRCPPIEQASRFPVRVVYRRTGGDGQRYFKHLRWYSTVATPEPSLSEHESLSSSVQVASSVT